MNAEHDREKQYDISVIVPIYNAAQYLPQCVESILAQTKDKIEIVLVNDGATDDSPQIIRTYAAGNDDIVVVEQENKGLAGARISGYRASHGRYIGWVDADDFIDPEMYRKLFDLAQSQQADLVYCDYAFYPHPVRSKPKWFREYTGVRDWKFIDKNTSFWSKLMRRDLLERVGITDLLAEYGDYSPIVPMLEAEKIAYTREELYHYRVGHTTMSGGSFVGKVGHYRACVEGSAKLIDLIRGKPYEKELAEYFEYRYIYACILLALVAAKNRDRAQYDYAQKELRRVNYRKNRYLFTAVKESYGAAKAFVLTGLIPIDYRLAERIAAVAI